MKYSHYAFVLWLTILTTRTTVCTIDETTKKDDSAKTFHGEKLSTSGINQIVNSNNKTLESTLMQNKTNGSNLHATPNKALDDSIEFGGNSSIEVSTNGYNGTNCNEGKFKCAIVIFISNSKVQYCNDQFVGVIINNWSYYCKYHLSFLSLFLRTECTGYMIKINACIISPTFLLRVTGP